MSLKDKYCIVGAATTKFGRVPGSRPSSFTVEAARLAIEDAGLEKDDVDAVLCKYPDRFQEPVGPQSFPGARIQPVIAATIDQAGGDQPGTGAVRDDGHRGGADNHRRMLLWRQPAIREAGDLWEAGRDRRSVRVHRCAGRLLDDRPEAHDRVRDNE